MMRFCRECNNLLHPRENKDLRRLEFACKLCPYIDRNSQGVSAIWVNEIVKDSSTTLDKILSDLNKDPTLQRSKEVECPACAHREAVFFQSEQTAKSTALKLIFICCACGEKWEG